MATQGGLELACPQQIGEAWNDENKLVVGIDIGTTNTAVSVMYLSKGEYREKPVIHRISQWPGQSEEDKGAKIPTVVWYDPNTKEAKLFGAEAMSHEGKQTAKDNNWFLVKHFKLHLQPEDQRKQGMHLDPIPRGVSLSQIYSDFLGYLLKHTQAFVERGAENRRIPHGDQIWAKYKSTMEVVIAHPNGWEIRQQDILRKAVIESGFVHASKASRQVQFVTEAEASVHYCVHHSSLNDKLEPGTKLLVCDAGGSTVDSTLYSVISTTPVLRMREVQLSGSIQMGGLFVNKEFEKFIRQALKNLKLNASQADDFAEIADEDFEFVSKRKFDGSIKASNGSEYISVKVAGTNFNRHGNSTAQTKIHRGRMNVHSSTIKKCFDVSINKIKSSVGDQLKNHSVQHVLLVGGYGDSPYLRKEFEGHFGSDSREVVLANEPTAKAVADGCVIWNILCSVVSRAPRRSFGMICGIPCFPWMNIPGGDGRSVYIGPDGVPHLLGVWNQTIKKGVPLHAEEIYREEIKHISAEPNPTSVSLETDLIGYSGDDEPMWAWDKNEKLLPKFQVVCTIKAQLYNLEGALKPAVSMTGVRYWYLDVEVCLHFGTTELQAHLEWIQNGIRRKGPATVVVGRPVDL